MSTRFYFPGGLVAGDGVEVLLCSAYEGVHSTCDEQRYVICVREDVSKVVGRWWDVMRVDDVKRRCKYAAPVVSPQAE